ncbi:Uncharacterised protein [Vibrio cholerae]|uniref:Uncharacterized protein n=1 Tax=Vibrio cholerae TaxID=666 RepID=A0A655XNK5_VIBCL|nr:Uncharacterised protein [Vibrio cholerae]
MIIGINQYDIVVHHNPCQSNHPDARHDDAKRFLENQQSSKNPYGRENHRGQNQEGLIETIELGDQNDRHRRECNHKRFFEENRRMLLLLVLTTDTKLNTTR